MLTFGEDPGELFIKAMDAAEKELIPLLKAERDAINARLNRGRILSFIKYFRKEAVPFVYQEHSKMRILLGWNHPSFIVPIGNYFVLNYTPDGNSGVSIKIEKREVDKALVTKMASSK